MPSEPLPLKSLRSVTNQIQDGDLLLFRGRGPLSSSLSSLLVGGLLGGLVGGLVGGFASLFGLSLEMTGILLGIALLPLLLLLFFWFRSPICVVGRGIHSHVGMAVWWGPELFCIDVSWLGGRPTSLTKLVQRLPGQIDVYRPNAGNRWPDYNQSGAVSFMRSLCGCSYGWWGLISAALLHLPIVRWFVKPDMDDLAMNRRPPFCSQARAMADRVGGGVDPVPNLADRLTEPADLARSTFYRGLFTLTVRR